MDKNLQEQIEATLEDTIVEEATSAQTKESVADVSIDMKWDEDGNKVMANDDPMGEEKPDDVVEDEEDMMGHPDEEKEDMMYPKEEEDMAEHGDEEEKMAYPKDDEDKMAKDEEPMEEMGYDKDKMPSATVAIETEDDDNAEEAKEDSDASFTESEKQELERFRREEKEKILESYKKFLSETVYAEFSTALDGFNREDLERELKIKVADYFMAQAKEEQKATELESKKEFKTLQVINQLKDKGLSTDIGALVDKYKK